MNFFFEYLKLQQLIYSNESLNMESINTMIIDFLNEQFEKQDMQEINEDVKSFLQAFQTLHKLSNGFYINVDKMDKYSRLFEFSV
jgi:hypothetical protein